MMHLSIARWNGRSRFSAHLWFDPPRPIVMADNLRAARLDPLQVDVLAAMIATLPDPRDPIPQDASVAASGRTAGDVQFPPVAAVEAGRDRSDIEGE
ncbi:MAG: hypothetical protein ACOY45_02705 [Pseudomonadota bacterium]